MSDDLNNKKALRALIRQRRRALGIVEQKRRAEELRRRFCSSGLMFNNQRIALYLSNDGEIDPAPLIKQLHKCGKQVYLPVLDSLKPGYLIFRAYREKCQLRKNRFGIPEPISNRRHDIKPKFLSLVLVPLVAFDRDGNRLGMGGGYYDRTFAFRATGTTRLPKLIGIAYELQKVEKLPVESWDVPLKAILTNSRLYKKRPKG